MKTTLYHSRGRTRFVMAVGAGWAIALMRLTAADEPPAATAPAPAPAASTTPAPPGTWFVFSPPKDEEVLAPTSRTKLLNLAKSFLVRDNPDLQSRLQKADNPFYVKQPPPPAPVAAGNSTSTSSVGPAQPVVQPKVTDEDRLQTFADKLQPTGMIEGAGKSLVTYSGIGGGTIEVGQPFTVTVPPDTTPVSVVIVDANETSCTLKLNSATLPVIYFAKSAGASHPPSSTSPTQPKP